MATEQGLAKLGLVGRPLGIALLQVAQSLRPASDSITGSVAR